MNVQEKDQKFCCEICGNEVIVTKVGGGELICCGEPMDLVVNESEI
ncbi:MAG: desulfoferrodoxin FeS4 iron-binding domain-containing protein [Patescibacteria group bacterium]|nr:desulfoferrodoxin FeS4 iron-binding domain-containing protein [Patescibacteria group bacterium]MDD4304678.1 desulfoferrodoxin FeS4 iron-binding domain-containing protein [Patescibacteria group bacterium]MDD4695354.1 desulfoferrodoxin FeS4 iron-binding domain-containing protein [Patescibacteria group bacterium]